MVRDNTGMWMRNLFDAVLPGSCAFCGALRRGAEKNICRGCYEDLPWIQSAPPPVSSPLQNSVAPLSFEFPVDIAVKAFKFRRKLFYAPAFAEILCEACARLPDDIDVVLPVPLHWTRKMTRGFNQSMELARPVAKHLAVPIVSGVRRVRATPFQSGLTARERERNLRRAFAVRHALAYEHVLIVDDVITTGATASALASVLLVNGATRVSLLAVARAC